MCKDTFGKQAINWRGMTPRLQKMRQKMMFQHIINGKDHWFLPVRVNRGSKGCLRDLEEPDGAVGESTAFGWSLSVTAVYAWWTQEAENVWVHRLINGCAATGCQNMTQIVKLGAFL